jgi:hypothetical protein
MEKSYKEKRNSFAERLKSEPTAMTIQQVEPIAVIAKKVEEPKTEEIQINAWIPKDLMKRIKTKAVIEEKSIKEIVVESLMRYVNE